MSRPNTSKRKRVANRRKRKARRERKKEYGKRGKAYKMCTRKRRYHSRLDAELNASRLVSDNGLMLRVYKCPLCHGWHLSKVRHKTQYIVDTDIA